LGFKVGEGHDILHGILGRVALFFMAREGHCFSRGFTTILVALPPLNIDNSLIEKTIVMIVNSDI
jgi:hypothetical protein